MTLPTTKGRQVLLSREDGRPFANAGKAGPEERAQRLRDPLEAACEPLSKPSTSDKSVGLEAPGGHDVELLRVVAAELWLIVHCGAIPEPKVT